jgi:tetratricopeptide (TPR) repeat protein
MFKNAHCGLICLLAILFLAAGCRPKSDATPPLPPPYFHTSFQDESQFIVESIVSDLAEQMFYLAYHRLPDQKYFSVTANEKPGSPVDAPVYELQIKVDPKVKNLKLELGVNGPIWSPSVYKEVAANLAGTIGIKAAGAASREDLTLMSKLADGRPETIEGENQGISAALEKNFGDAELHEQAALLLGAFLLRDHSGSFFDIRFPLSRITAHLAMAQFLHGTGEYGTNGKMALAFLLTLIGDEAPALKQLDAIGTNDDAVLPVTRALRARNTGDYRELAGATNRSQIESVEWFLAMSGFVSTTRAWEKLTETQQRTIDFVRVANQEGFSVQAGHQIADVSFPLEMREIQNIYKLSHPVELSHKNLIDALNQVPERGFTVDTNGNVSVRVIGWGQWADFLQRHLCNAIMKDFYFFNYEWGVPDMAADFASNSENEVGALRLYPFVRRFDCTNVDGYHQSVDDGFQVTVDSPQLVPAECWNSLCERVYFAPAYDPNPNPHLSEWFNHNPPPGTVYDLPPRLHHLSLVSRAGTLAHFETLRQLAPYDCGVVNYILTRKYTNHPPYDKAVALFGPVLPYSVTALRTVANAAQDQPGQYEKYMLQAAELDPACYYDLGDYEWNQQHEDKAAEYIDKACELDVDAVRIANHSYWRVGYCMRKGQIEKAREIADYGAEVYSGVGLQAKALFMEDTTNYDEAFQWYLKNEERYNDSWPLVEFCIRCKEEYQYAKFDAELEKREHLYFPNGTERASLNDFQNQPTNGVLIQQQNDLLLSYGLKAGDVIVALDGVRTHNFAQYRFVRATQDKPGLDLIVWQSGDYHEVNATPPNHLFGVNFGDYTR